MDPIQILHATNHYRNNADHYNSVRAHLSATRQKFEDANREQQIRMLQKSHAFAALSVQTSVNSHEKAFTNLFDDGFPESRDEIAESISMCNYYKSKADYVWESIQKSDEWDTVADLIESGRIDDAHKYIIDEFRGVSTVKAAFTLSMLGYTQKMCIDTNICQLAGIDRPTTVVIDRYESTVQRIRSMLPTLSNEASEPFIFQWALFDYMRGDTSTHAAFFDEVHK